MEILIVGAGFSGAVMARELAEKIDAQVTVIDKRNHIAGNCHTERDDDTGVMLHKYGAHIFHTSNVFLWNYIQKFGEFRPFINRPKASISSGIYSFPINLHTINQFFSLKLSPVEAKEFIDSKADKSIVEPKNFEEQALKFIGDELYRAFFYGYTKKQWGCEPKELPASILRRLPLRFNYNDNYYRDIYQGIPLNGYTDIIKNILNHKRIKTILNVVFDDNMVSNYDWVFYTGPIDEFYKYKHGRLAYRTVYWNKETYADDHLGHPVINFPEMDVLYTRKIEHKHFAYWENLEKTIVFTEYSKETGLEDDAYYPKRLYHDKIVLKNYIKTAQEEQSVSFLGRLATYRYMDMHQVIEEAVNMAEACRQAYVEKRQLPVFPEGYSV